TCIGNVLARLEGRVVFEEFLKRIPNWEIDYDNAVMLSTSTVRGWDKLPAYVNQNGARKIKAKYAKQAEAAAAPVAGAPASIEGNWKVTIKGPTGPQDTTLNLKAANGVLGGTQSGDGMTNTIEEITYDSKTGD